MPLNPELKEIILSYGQYGRKETGRTDNKLHIAFSGGVDSTFLLQAAIDTLGAENVTALTAQASVMIPGEMTKASDFCKVRKIEHKVIDCSSVIMTPAFTENPPDRCYHCKKYIFTQLLRACDGQILCDGTNLDDMDDYRPGRAALAELGIKSPLLEAGLTKSEIRNEMKEMGLENWNSPACACLASRIPYGQPVTSEKTEMIAAAEKKLHELGFTQIRVRCHQIGDELMGRIEILPAERYILYSDDIIDTIYQFMNDAGFGYAVLDLGGYKMGSLNRF